MTPQLGTGQLSKRQEPMDTASMDKERPDLLSGWPVVVNIGLPEFFESLVDQGVRVVHIDWRPQAPGSEESIDLLSGLL
jgi:hypothetical protein